MLANVDSVDGIPVCIDIIEGPDYGLRADACLDIHFQRMLLVPAHDLGYPAGVGHGFCMLNDLQYGCFGFSYDWDVYRNVP